MGSTLSVCYRCPILIKTGMCGYILLKQEMNEKTNEIPFNDSRRTDRDMVKRETAFF
jgi:predicted aspartyl protease